MLELKTTSPVDSASAAAPKLATERLTVHYGTVCGLRDVSLAVAPRSITAIIGPSGCGKSTLLRCFNRMNDGIRGFRQEGRLLLDGQEIDRVPAEALRRRVGMVFQRPNPFPLTVYENVAYGPRIHGMARGRALDEIVEGSLQATGLWEEMRGQLGTIALGLSPEQQQRLCIARLLAVRPEVLLMDEPCSTLDPFATQQIEETMRRLASDYTIVIVTHNMQQAARVSTRTGFMLLGDLVEFGPTEEIFTRPRDRRTQDYVSGRFG